MLIISGEKNDFFMDFGVCKFEGEMERLDMPTQLINYEGEYVFLFNKEINKSDVELDLQRFVNCYDIWLVLIVIIIRILEYREGLSMMLFENNTGYTKISIWKDEIPIFCTTQKNLRFGKSVNNTLNWHEGIICVEALLGPWHANNYAMVCMKYSSGRKEADYEIRI